MNHSRIEQSPAVQDGGPELERHYSPKELAGQWGVDQSTIRRWFADVPGVLRARWERNPQPGRKRLRFTMRIPASVARDFHRENEPTGSLEVKL